MEPLSTASWIATVTRKLENASSARPSKTPSAMRSRRSGPARLPRWISSTSSIATANRACAAAAAASLPTASTSLTGRSEEHTSELQSQSNLVCRLLLEKKKQSHLTLKLAPSHTQLYV